MERKKRRVPAFSVLPAPPELREDPEPCTHTWGEPVRVSFSRGDQAVFRVCETCQGFARRCKQCRRFHLEYKGEGGQYSMPWCVPAEWLKEHGCARRNLGEVPIPFVSTPDASYLAEFNLANYREIGGEPGLYELEWLS